MSPSQYISEQYLRDLKRFTDFNQLSCPIHNPGVLCGFTMGGVLFPDFKIHYQHPVDFIICLFELNLFDQGIYTYFPRLDQQWKQFTLPFPNVRYCFHGHGLGSHAPANILRFAGSPLGKMESVQIDPQKLRAYNRFFAFDYVGMFLKESGSDDIRQEFINLLEDDVDAQGFSIS